MTRYFDLLFAGWGYPGDRGAYGCKDKSDITQDMIATDALNLTCGDIYTLPIWGNFSVDWTWFHCLKTRKCIHIDNRCDLHPNPECIYEKNGVMVAEDEEGCFEEYKRKGLLAKSANLICQSLYHNVLTPAISWINQTFTGSLLNVTVIPSGTMVEIVATRCDGLYECSNNEDEYKCQQGEIETVSIGINSPNHFI